MNKKAGLHEFRVGNEIYPYNLKFSNRKSLEIKIKTDGQIYVSVPFHMNLTDIEDVLMKKSEWIANKLSVIDEQAKINKFNIKNMANIPFMGRDIIFDVQEFNAKRVNIKLSEKKLELLIPIGFRSLDRDVLVKENLKRFYIKQTEEYLKGKLNYYAEKLHVKFLDCRVKDQKSRWGSCSSRGNLNFNFRLSMTPEFVFDYIIAHELCHLKEMNHSQRFWKLVEDVYPDYKEAKKWLKNNSLRLMFI